VENRQPPNIKFQQLTWFFGAIGLGALLLGIGILSLNNYLKNRPAPLALPWAIAITVAGVSVDAWAVKRLLRQQLIPPPVVK
jgi:hypothetical protein